MPEKIYRKILEIYPFLSEGEVGVFKNRSEEVLNKFKEGGTRELKAIESMISLLESHGHAEVRRKRKINKNLLKIVTFFKKPSLEIEDRVLFIKIPSWWGVLEKIDEKLIGFCRDNVDKYDALVFDVRQNSGGSSEIAHNFAGIFFKENVVYGEFVKKNEKGGLEKIEGKLLANKDIYIDKPIAILISKKCFSSNELFLAPFKVSERAVLIGEETRGGSANSTSKKVEIDGKKYIVRIPTWRFFIKEEKEPIERTRIKPDIVYKKRDIKNFAKGYLLKTLDPVK